MGRGEEKIATGRFRMIETCILPQRRADRFSTETALNSDGTWIPLIGRWKLIFPRRARRRYRPYFNSGSDAFKKIYRLFTLNVKILWLIAGNFQINRAKKSRYRFRNFLQFEKTIFKFEERFQRMISEIYNLQLTKGINYITLLVSEKVSSVGYKLAVQ